MYCMKCGKEISDSAKFCKYCGAPAAEASSPAGAPGPEGIPAGRPAAERAAGPEGGPSGAPAPGRAEKAVPSVKKAGAKRWIILAVVLCAAAAAGIGIFFGVRAKRAQNAYDAIGYIGFSDESILTPEEQAELSALRDRREAAYEKKNVRDLNDVQADWEAFRAPIEEIIAPYEETAAGFFTEEEKAHLTEAERAECEELAAAVEEAYRARDLAALQTACSDWEAFSAPIRTVMDIYGTIDSYSYTDAEMSLLSADTQARMQELRGQTDEAFAARDADRMNELAAEWDTFRSDTAAELEAAREQLLRDWVADAEAMGSLGNLLSFGLTTTTSEIQGHTIVICTQYNTDFGVSDSDISAALDSYLSASSGMYQAGVDSLKPYVEDVCIRIEYKNAEGSVVSSREFR